MDDDTSVSVDINSSQNEMDVRNERRVATKKTNKPLIEKRRRARINECLQQLKDIIVKDRQLDNARGNRLEKADILEMTVDYIRQLSQGSPVSCLQHAYERGVERCVREMSEFMSSHRDVIDSSVTQKLTNHCLKMLGHHPHADEVMSPVSGSKRTVHSTIETVADSSTSPKRYRIDEENDNNVSITGENHLADHNDHRFTETQKPETMASPQSTSPVPVALHSSATTSRFIKTPAPALQITSPNACLPNVLLTDLSEPVGSSNVELSNDTCSDVILTSSCTDSTANDSSNKHIDTPGYSVSPGVEKQSLSVSITPASVTPPLSNFISKPVFFSYPGNIFILMDNPAVLPQPVLQKHLPGSVFPGEQNILTVLPTPLTYKLPTPLTCTPVNSTCVEPGFPQPNISGSYGSSFSLQAMFPQHQTAARHFTSGSDNSVPVLLNPGILLKREPGNNTLLSLGQNPAVQYLSFPQDHQNVARQVFQHSPETFSQYFHNTSGQISQNLQGSYAQISQNVQQVSSATAQHHQAKLLQQHASTSANNIPVVTNTPACVTFYDQRNSPVIPGNKLPENKLPEDKLLEHRLLENKLPEHRLTEHRLPEHRLPEHRLPEHRLLEHRLPKHDQTETKLPEYNQSEHKLSEYNLPKCGLSEHKQAEHKLLEYEPLEEKLLKAVTPKEHNQLFLIYQASTLPETSSNNSVEQSLDVSERAPHDLEDLPADFRLYHADGSCSHPPSGSRQATHGSCNLPPSGSRQATPGSCNLPPSGNRQATPGSCNLPPSGNRQVTPGSCNLPPSGSRLVTPGYKASSANEVRQSSLSYDESSNITYASLSPPMGGSTNKHTHEELSTHASDNQASDSSMESCILFKSSNTLSKAVSHLLVSSSSDTQEIFSRLQEPSGVLDLSCKVEVNSSCRSDSSDVDVNNNAVRCTGRLSNRNDVIAKPSVGLKLSDATNKIYTDCLSNLIINRDMSNQGYSQKETVDYSPCTNSCPGLDQGSVWRPWGDNQELKEFN